MLAELQSMGNLNESETQKLTKEFQQKHQKTIISAVNELKREHSDEVTNPEVIKQQLENQIEAIVSLEIKRRVSSAMISAICDDIDQIVMVQDDGGGSSVKKSSSSSEEGFVKIRRISPDRPTEECGLGKTFKKSSAPIESVKISISPAADGRHKGINDDETAIRVSVLSADDESTNADDIEYVRRFDKPLDQTIAPKGVSAKMGLNASKSPGAVDAKEAEQVLQLLQVLKRACLNANKIKRV